MNSLGTCSGLRRCSSELLPSNVSNISNVGATTNYNKTAAIATHAADCCCRALQGDNTLQHTATHCTILQNTIPHCNTLQYTARYCITLKQTATHCNTLQHTAPHCTTLHNTAPHCTTLQHTAPHCNTLQHTTTYYNILQHAATQCNTLQHTATHAVNCKIGVVLNTAHINESCLTYECVISRI